MAEFDLDEIKRHADEVKRERTTALKQASNIRKFKNKMKTKKIDSGYENVSVFGVKNVNINAILKDNLLDRSIFTTDKLCRMFLSCTLDQLKKYEKKKRAVPMNMLWILMLMFGVIIVVLVVIFLLPQLGGVI
jgi:hypothetical protein